MSVVLPTFQRRELVRRAVASVLAQSFTDLELIVVDDGSTDGTDEVLEGVDPRLRYVWQENAGVAAARNRALGLARGPMISFLDSDNRWLPDHLSVLTAIMERNPEAVLASTCPRFQVSGSEQAIDAEVVDLRHRVLSYTRRPGFISCVAVRREAMVAVGGFDERLRAGEDTDLFLRLGTLGAIATVRRRTLVRQTTADSLRDRSQASGDYLKAAALSAGNLGAASERLPEPQRSVVRSQAKGAAHLANAMRILDRDGDQQALARDLAQVARLLPASSLPNQLESRVRRHLTRGQDLATRVEALRTVSELWPDDRADTARYLRGLVIVAELRLGRPLRAARLLADWRWPGTAGFARRLAPTVHGRIRRTLQDRRQRESRGGRIRGGDSRARRRRRPQTPSAL